jgi:hypothetical protein
VTDLKSPRQAESSAIEPARIKTIRPVLFWSSLGTVFVVIAAYVYISWIASGNATPVNPGPDPIPGATRWAMTAFQIACPILALVAIGYVIRKSVRERQLCIEAAIVIGSAIAWWHDPLINWFQPALFYNAGLVNFGNWTQNIPGWLSPDGRLMAEPVLRHRVPARDLRGAPRSARLSGVDSRRHIMGGSDRPDPAVWPHPVVAGSQFEWRADVLSQP